VAFDVKRWLAGAKRLAAAIVLAPVHLYRLVISPALPARCKYHPSCSRYAIDAVREVGAMRGIVLAAWRLARCNPWSDGGFDPIEQRAFFRSSGRNPVGPRPTESQHGHGGTPA
jgi:putative membrane protein insertion efficiency factor